jgi:dTDP-4-dehydrorhamnose 3,5-epimerase
VVVDLRVGSPTYGEWEAVELDDQNMRIFYVPIGFAHGFCVTSEIADVFYKQSGYYSGATERGISYRDPDVAIDWPLPAAELLPSARDPTRPASRRSSRSCRSSSAPEARRAAAKRGRARRVRHT